MKDKIPLYQISIRGGNYLFSIIFMIGLFLPSSIYKAPDIVLKASKPSLVDKISEKTRIRADEGANNKKNKYLHIQAKKSEHLYHPIIIEASKRYQVDPSLIKAIILAESGYNPKAVSKRGAKGLMQLMPGTAEALGVEDSFNPEHNINGGVKYLKQLVTQFDGDVKLALAAYNAGSKKVRKYRGIPPFKATRYYIKKVIEYQNIYKKLRANSTRAA